MAVAVEFNHIPETIAALHKAGVDIVVETSKTVLSNCRGHAAIDTGFMMNSLYLVNAEDDTYGQAGSSSSKGGYLVPHVEMPGSDQEAIVATGANYSIYQELGTRHMPAHPWVLPGAEEARPDWDAAWQNIERRLGGV